MTGDEVNHLGEVSQLFDQATNALARLDVEALARLEEQALKLQALLGANVSVSEEIAARQRVFAGVLRATEENLAVLGRFSTGSSRARRSWDR